MHIDIKFHFVKDAQQNGIVAFKFVPTDKQNADGLTKGLSGPKTATFRNCVSGKIEPMQYTVEVPA